MQLMQAYLFLSSANPVLFALERMREEVRQNERQKDKKNINFISMLCWAFIGASSAPVSSLIHTSRPGSINVCKAFLTFDLV